ncbi:MAG: peptidylprolyl isomerase [Myxococcales bacterium]|nr:MAG: peptidylprolyl isomerase [Myxococcales bacterium]
MPRRVEGLSQYVLEVNAGFVQKQGIVDGTQVRFNNVPGQPISKAASSDLSDSSALQLEPSSPDPLDGKFSLSQATAGLRNKKNVQAKIVTSLGTLSCKLFAGKTPNTVANFVGLARGLRPFWDPKLGSWQKGPYFDGTTFHRVIPGFMIQGGDIVGDGRGTPGYAIKDEMVEGLKHDKAGLLCMANRGPHTNGAQFFITDGAAPHLDQMNSFTIFGECEPLSLVAKIARVPQSGPPSNTPKQAVTIEHLSIE